MERGRRTDFDIKTNKENKHSLQMNFAELH